jgi:hypothetical protein
MECETAVQHGHAGPRLTDAGLLDYTEARLTILQRVWGSDPRFLAEHGREYEEVVREQHLKRARVFLSQARTSEARTELHLAHGGPLLYKVLASMPPAAVRVLLTVLALTKSVAELAAEFIEKGV